MKTVLRSLTIVVFCGFAGVINAAVIYDNGAFITEDATQSNVSGAFQLADDFILQAGANTITDIHWWGAYFDTAPSASADDFSIFFYTDDSGLPSNTLAHSISVGNSAARTDTGELVGNLGSIWEYSLNVPAFTLNAGIPYWISIQNNLLPDYIWYWEWSASSGGNMALFTTGGAWENQVEAVAFNLTGQVPVPATLALFGLGLAGLGWSRRKKA